MSVWDAVIGQEAVVSTLRAAVEDPRAMTHAWLITGPPGSGRSVAAARRAGVAPDRLEREPDTFHADVREAFLQLAAADPSRYLVLDAAQDPDVVHAAIVERVADLLAARGGTAAAGGGAVVGDGADADGTGRNGADADGTGRDGEVAP